MRFARRRPGFETSLCLSSCRSFCTSILFWFLAAFHPVRLVRFLPFLPTSFLAYSELFEGARKVRTGFDELKGKTPTRGSPSEWAAFLQQMKEDQDRMDQHIRPFEEGLPSSYNAQIVMRVNSLQMLYAERWIVSSKPDFSLPMKMLADDPTLRERRKLEVE